MRFLVVFALLATALAACTDNGSPKEAPSGEAPAGQDQPDLGTLVVLVTTSELAPVEAAVVEVAGTARTGITDPGGRTTFTGLEPAEYTVLAAKPGYRSLQDKGRIVQVVAGESVEAKLVLDAVDVVDAQSGFHRSFIFRGFISCSIERVTVSPVFNRTQCGNGVDVLGTRVGRDPNDNFSHPWQVENGHIMSIVLENQWSPSFAALGDQLYIAAMDAFTCSAQSCNYANEVGGKGGRSPLYVAIHESNNNVITKSFERHGGNKYPKPAWSIARTFCGSPCTVAVTLQQSYEMVTSAFYGLPAPAGWSARAEG